MMIAEMQDSIIDTLAHQVGKRETDLVLSLLFWRIILYKSESEVVLWHRQEIMQQRKRERQRFIRFGI